MREGEREDMRGGIGMMGKGEGEEKREKRWWRNKKGEGEGENG